MILAVDPALSVVHLNCRKLNILSSTVEGSVAMNGLFILDCLCTNHCHWSELQWKAVWCCLWAAGSPGQRVSSRQQEVSWVSVDWWMCSLAVPDHCWLMNSAHWRGAWCKACLLVLSTWSCSGYGTLRSISSCTVRRRVMTSYNSPCYCDVLREFAIKLENLTFWFCLNF